MAARELLVIVILMGSALLGVLIAGIVVLLVLRHSRPVHRFTGVPIGSPRRIRRLQPADPPLSTSAKWLGDVLQVEASAASTKSLFDVPLERLDQCLLTYRFRIKCNHLTAAVYPELWCRIPEKGQFFSRGVDRKIRGTHDWTEVEIPFHLEPGQPADLVHLNLVFEGAGKVELREIEVLATPLKPTPVDR
jgi:hypothetical protein